MSYHGKKVMPAVFDVVPAQHCLILKMYANTSPQRTQRSLRILNKQIFFHYEQTVMVLTSKTSAII